MWQPENHYTDMEPVYNFDAPSTPWSPSNSLNPKPEPEPEQCTPPPEEAEEEEDPVVRYDANNDGIIDYSEYQAAIQDYSKGLIFSQGLIAVRAAWVAGGYQN